MLQECTVTGEQEPLKNKVSIKTAWREINTISEIYFLVRRNIICVLRSVVVGRLRPLHCLLKLYQLMLDLCHTCLRRPQFWTKISCSGCAFSISSGPLKREKFPAENNIANQELIAQCVSVFRCNATARTRRAAATSCCARASDPISSCAVSKASINGSNAGT